MDAGWEGEDAAPQALRVRNVPAPLRRPGQVQAQNQNQLELMLDQECAGSLDMDFNALRGKYSVRRGE